MKYIKILSFDIRDGILKNKAMFLCPAVIALFALVDFSNRLNRLESRQIVKESAVSFGDCWLYLYGGMKEYIPAPGSPFLFPVIWIILFVTIPFLLLNYPMKDMRGFGQQVVARAGGRTVWWVSKCCWSILATVLYHLFLLTPVVLFCLIQRIPLSPHVDRDLLSAAYNIGAEMVQKPSLSIPLSVFVLPLVVSAAMNLVQTTLSLFIRPILSFLSILIFFGSSAWLMAPYLPGNFAMPLRHDWIVQNGLFWPAGFAVSGTLLILATATCLFRFRTYDILNKEADRRKYCHQRAAFTQGVRISGEHRVPSGRAHFPGPLHGV